MTDRDSVFSSAHPQNASFSTQNAVNSLTRHIAELENVRDNVMQASQERNSARKEADELRQKVETLQAEVSSLKVENKRLNLSLSKEEESVQSLEDLVSGKLNARQPHES